MTAELTIKVCLAADKNYLQHLVVTMASILLKLNPGERVDFLILSDGSLENRHFKKVLGLAPSSVEVVNATELVHQYMELAYNPEWPISVNYRLLIPFLCPSDDRMIYLDSDTIVRTSLSGLWKIPLEGMIAGVADTGFDHAGRLAGQGLSLSDPYINSGVLLWNLEKIRADYSERLNAVAKRVPSPEFPDQDWINLMFESDKQLLDPSWNSMSHLFSEDWKPDDLYAPAQIDKAQQQPDICHFTNIKPWTMTYNEHPYWFEYWEVLRHTPFSGRYPMALLKKALLTNRDGFVFRKVRPALKKILRVSG